MRTAAKPIPPISAEVEARIWASIDKGPDGVWAWLRPRSKPHDARIFISGELYAANRVFWVLNQRRTNPDYQIPDGMDVCHRHDVTAELYDCNWDNLWLGIHEDNMRDKMAKGRGNHPTGERNGRHTKPENWPRGDQHHFRLHPELISSGEKNGSAKLKWVQVHEIRALYAAGGITQNELASRFGVAQYTISAIIRRETWAGTGPE